MSIKTAIVFLSLLAGCTVSNAQNASADNSYFYVANTRPLDAFLSLRTDPTTKYGLSIVSMPNGTLLQALQRRDDGWWYVRCFPRARRVGRSVVRATGCGLSAVQRFQPLRRLVKGNRNRLASKPPQTTFIACLARGHLTGRVSAISAVISKKLTLRPHHLHRTAILNGGTPLRLRKMRCQGNGFSTATRQ